MKDLIEALTIIQNCLLDSETRWSTACEHDILYVCEVDFDKVTVDILHELAKLGFYPGSEDDGDYAVKLILRLLMEKPGIQLSMI